jgi:hypothetical protein
VSGEHYILNMYLQKGTIPIFIDFADEFFGMITRYLEQSEKLGHSPAIDFHNGNGYEHLTAGCTNPGSSSYDHEMADMDGDFGKTGKAKGISGDMLDGVVLPG